MLVEHHAVMVLRGDHRTIILVDPPGPCHACGVMRAWFIQKDEQNPVCWLCAKEE